MTPPDVRNVRVLPGRVYIAPLHEPAPRGRWRRVLDRLLRRDRLSNRWVDVGYVDSFDPFTFR